jgi:hypothetical protein
MNVNSYIDGTTVLWQYLVIVDHANKVITITINIYGVTLYKYPEIMKGKNKDRVRIRRKTRII